METEDTGGNPGDVIQQVQILQPGDTLQQGETIMLNLEDVIFQQSGLSVDDTNQLQPGTYQIITHQLPGDVTNGQVQVSLTDGISMIQAAGVDQLQGLDIGVQSIFLQQAVDGSDGNDAVLKLADGSMIPSPAGHAHQEEEPTVFSMTEDQVVGHAHQGERPTVFSMTEGQTLTDQINRQLAGGVVQEDFDGQSESVLQIDLPVSQSVSMLDVINRAIPSENVKVEPDGDSAVLVDTFEEASEQADLTEDSLCVASAHIKPEESQSSTAHDMGIDQVPSSITESMADTSSPVPTHEEETTPVEKKPTKTADLSKPIDVTDHMEVVVGGKKCLLKINPETGKLCAYPLVTTTSSGKRRGRPRKSETSNKPPKDSDHMNSAAEGLLELSNTGPDGIRRSGRSRKKAYKFEDYEAMEVSSDDAAAEDAEDEVLPTGAVRKRKISQRDYIPTTPVPVPGAPKRGRGRPRRYPRPDDIQPTSQISAMIIPSTDGSTIMMAPLQGLTDIEAFQQQVKCLPMFQSQTKLEVTDEASQYLNTSAVISLNDTSQTNIVLQAGGGDVGGGEIVTASLEDVAMKTDLELSADTTGIVHPEGTELTDLGGTDTSAIALTTPNDADSPGSTTVLTNTDEGQPTIIQIPENLLPMFMQKKDPVKIGLKASDLQLDSLRCLKCGYQAYYQQQYQNHIVTHTEDIITCKCCNFAAFDKFTIMEHFKENHPKCICSVCDHMAEHAYIIKRHMMRHSQEGCKCDICGKVYKDQYVLKMHIKMVHLPAEVLFECTICTKKFTRKAHLKRHLRIHDPEKPYKCPHCVYRGVERSDISKHLLIHEEPKHVCEVCGKAFRHIKNKELHLKRHNGQKDYKCGVCDFYGYTFTDIRKHIERKHTDAKTYICDKCGTAYKSEQQLREHRTQECDVFMIEQALAIATSDGGTSQARIQIPSSLSLNGQHLQIDGHNIAIENDGHITMEPTHLTEDGIPLTEDQLQGQIAAASHMIHVITGEEGQYTAVPEAQYAAQEADEAELEEEDMASDIDNMEDEEDKQHSHISDHLTTIVVEGGDDKSVISGEQLVTIVGDDSGKEGLDDHLEDMVDHVKVDIANQLEHMVGSDEKHLVDASSDQMLQMVQIMR